MIKQTLIIAFLLGIAQFSFAQSGILGKWKTIDDETNQPKSIIEITEQDGKYFGKVTEILTDRKDAVCDECDGDKKDKPVLGMVILENLEVYKDYFSYGSILDPNNGKVYKCSVWQESPDQLTVRGYIGISALGRSQNWYRVK